VNRNSMKYANREAWRAAKKARVPLIMRPFFVLTVIFRWKQNGHSIEDALNVALTNFYWKRIR
jgi:hypothetical protein